jgi:CspA family cold shock protein
VVGAPTPLHVAAAEGHDVVVWLLLERGADRDLRESALGATPAEWATFGGHEKLAALLRDSAWLPREAPRARGVDGPASSVTGTVKWFDPERGFGFIAADGVAEPVYCHHTVVEADGCHKDLADGQKVEFDLFVGAEGPVAANVRRVFDERGTLVTVLCADAVQIRTRSWGRPNLAKTADKLSRFGEVRRTEYLVRMRAPPHELTLFDDGRAIVKGTGEESVARALVATWVGVRLPE